MTRRSARFLTRLYPPAWRARYGEEFQLFLESRRVPLVEALNIVASAFSERAAGLLPILLYALVAAFAAGGALRLTASGVPLAQAIDAHPAFWLGWAIVEAISLALVAAGAVAVAPAVFTILRNPSREVLWKLAKPVGSGLLLVFWSSIYGGAIWKSWAADWIALLLLGGFAEATAGFLRYVIAHSGLRQSLGQGRLAALAMAASIVVTTITSAGWGFDAHIYTGASSGWGLYLYWSVVLTVLCGAAISGALSARRLFLGRID